MAKSETTTASSKKKATGRKPRGKNKVKITVELSEAEFNALQRAYRQARNFDATITRNRFRSGLMSKAVGNKLQAMKNAVSL
jgi:hypothetical protein